VIGQADASARVEVGRNLMGIAKQLAAFFTEQGWTR
jgi:hypothetical protein